MHSRDDTSIEEQLASITEWDGEEQALWKKALEARRLEQASSFRIFGMSWRIAAIAASIVLLVALSASFLISEDGARARSMAAPAASISESAGDTQFALAESVASEIPAKGARGSGTGGSSQSRHIHVDIDSLSDNRGAFAGMVGTGIPDIPKDLLPSWGHGGGASEAISRSIARKATIELLTDDVRAVFQKVSLLAQPAMGEYVDSSSLTGDEDRARAEIVLRVRADRLSSVLNALRDIAEVHAESQTGDDVTDQIVDLGARLRNEVRVEKELLELLESRQDAPLKDILELRNHLSSVRAQIERLEASRAALDHLVSLATVLVIIRPEPNQTKTETKESESLGAYFTTEMSESWRRGLLLLADTVSWLVRVVIGGIIWWALAFGVAIAIRSAVKRHQAAIHAAT